MVLSGFTESTIGCRMSRSLISDGRRGLFERGERELECDPERCDELLCDDEDFLSSSRFLSLDFLRSFERDEDERDVDDEDLPLELELLSDFDDDFESSLRRRGSRSAEARSLSDSRDFD